MAYISVVYTLFLEVQEWFVDKYKGNKSDKKCEKFIRLANWLSDVPLFLIPIIVTVSLLLVKRFLMNYEYTNSICILTIVLQTSFIYIKKKRELEIQKRTNEVLLEKFENNKPEIIK